MFTARELDGTLEDMFRPAFHNIIFSDETATVRITNWSRQAWAAIPHGEPPHAEQSSGKDAGKYQHRSEEGVKPASKSEDKEDAKSKEATRSEWRMAIYWVWNHIFGDVMKFLSKVEYGVGHFHAPEPEILSLKFPGGDDADGKLTVVKRSWGTNMLIIPAHLEKGVGVKMTRKGVEGEERVLGTFNEKNPSEAWWLKKNTEVSFHILGDFDRGSEGVAAVMALGTLCDERHQYGPHGKGCTCKKDTVAKEGAGGEIGKEDTIVMRLEDLRLHVAK